MGSVAIIGVGMSAQDLTPQHLEIIRSAEVLVGGRRLLDFVSDFSGETREIDRDLNGLLAFVEKRKKHRNVVVLASGDPLFFGIGALLARRLGRDQVTIYPNVSTAATAFARLGESWSGVPVMSLHGRKDSGELVEMVTLHDAVGIYTDPKNNPAWIAAQLRASGCVHVCLHIFERLGSDEEQVYQLTPDEAAARDFKDPNFVIVKRLAGPADGFRPLHLGMPERAFAHRKKLITKTEARAVALAKLCLGAGHILWDLGAGSGSVGIEASLLIGDGHVYAVERRSDRVADITENKRRFGVQRMDIVETDLPDGLDRLPDPDRVFIGGGGRRVVDILRAAVPRLKPGGIVVINTVLMETLTTVREELKQLGFLTETVQVQVSRGRSMPFGERLEAQTPVWIISAKRAGE